MFIECIFYCQNNCLGSTLWFSFIFWCIQYLPCLAARLWLVTSDQNTCLDHTLRCTVHCGPQPALPHQKKQQLVVLVVVLLPVVSFSTGSSTGSSSSSTSCGNICRVWLVQAIKTRAWTTPYDAIRVLPPRDSDDPNVKIAQRSAHRDRLRGAICASERQRRAEVIRNPQEKKQHSHHTQQSDVEAERPDEEATSITDKLSMTTCHHGAIQGRAGTNGMSSTPSRSHITPALTA